MRERLAEARENEDKLKSAKLTQDAEIMDLKDQVRESLLI